jgi:hypothetical protein
LSVLEEKLLKSSNVRIKFVTCGKDDCRCKLGFRHGPYYYIRKRIDGRYKDIYVKPPKEVPSLSYEAIGASLLLEIRSIDQLPDFLKNLPVFIIKKRVS